MALVILDMPHKILTSYNTLVKKNVQTFSFVINKKAVNHNRSGLYQTA